MEMLTSLLYAAIQYIFECIDEIMSYVVRRCLRGVMVIFSCFFVPYSRFTNLRVPNKKLPPITNSLLEIPAVELARLIRTKQVKSEKVVQAYIERCKDVNPLLNAIVEECFNDAIIEARNVDIEIERGVKSVKQMEIETPLLGVPITVKESISVKGMSNQGGRAFKKKRIAQDDAPSVKEVRKNGGIILLVSNTPELCMCWETYNRVTGQTRNPYDLKRTPGGSSGGEAALLGAGASLIGLSSDIAGSARIPASFTGIWGHKPTPYVVCPDGHMPGCNEPGWGEFFTIAPMTRYAVDLPLMLRCMSDPNGPKLTLDKEVDLKKVNFFYMENDGPSGMTRPISADIQVALKNISLYFNAKKVKIDKMKWSLEIAMSSMLRIKNIDTIYNYTEEGEIPKTVKSEIIKYFTGRSDSTLTSVSIGLLQDISQNVPESRHKKMAKIIDSLKNQFKELLGTNGVFLYPSNPTSAFPHYEVYNRLVDPAYLMVFNVLGLPVTNCMVGLDKKGLPISIQVVANPCQDHLTLAVAREIERVWGGWIKPPSEVKKN